MSKLTKALTAAAGNAGGDPLYVEDVFSTYLYEGNDSNGSTEQEIVNGLDLDGEGGMVWMKSRDGGRSHCLYDTERGNGNFLSSNTTAESYTNTSTPWRPTSTGFFTGKDYGGSENQNNEGIVSWSFRKAEKFFDVVTWTGDGSTTTHSHNLGSTPAVIIVKRKDSTSPWSVYHKDATDTVRSGEDLILYLNNDDAVSYLGSTLWAATDSTFTTTGGGNFNASGGTFIAYLFASDAGGFGDDGNENIIKCGSYTGNQNADGPSVDCGFEPQFLMVRNATGGNWVIADTMRSFGIDDMASLYPNIVNVESSVIAGKGITPTATGFKCIDGSVVTNQSNAAHVYIAIRRPMKTPESGTEIFSPYAYSDTGLTSGSGTASNRTIINGGSNGGSGFPVDQFWHQKTSPNSSYGFHIFDRIRGQGQALLTKSYSASPAGDSANNGGFDFQEGVDVQYSGEMYYYNSNAGNRSHLSYAFKRAAKAFDIVTYTGNATAGRAVTHNLQAVPEMMFVKAHSTSNEAHWVYHKTTGNAASLLVSGDGSGYGGFWNSTTPSAATFTVSNSAAVNSASHNYVAWLWATLDGVTKVGSYSGTGSNVDVDCGFSAGARFVLIKRSNGDGDWYVWDSARGIVTGNDPYVIFAGGSVTNTDYIDPLSSGFTVTSSAPAALNASGGTYIFLAIA